MSQESIPSIELLQKNKYISLTTYKKNKSSVSTPVWFALDNLDKNARRIFITTSKKAGKLKRIKHTSSVQFAFCSASGKIHGKTIQGIARKLDNPEVLHAHELLKNKYGLLFNLWATFYLRKNKRSYLEIVF